MTIGDRPSAVETWARLDEPWQVAFTLAWEALKAGSVPVGAVVVTRRGDVATRGRNRSRETEAPTGQIAGSYLAHAEINAVIQLPPRDYLDHTVYTTLEPCSFCAAALDHARLGTVLYAAADPMWGGIHHHPHRMHVEPSCTQGECALDGPLATWAELLPVTFAMRYDSPRVERTYRLRNPQLLKLARRLASQQALMDTRGPLLEILSQMWGPLHLQRY